MCLRRSFLSWLSAVMIVLASDAKPAIAGDLFRPISAEELKMTSEPLAPGAPATILYRQVDRDDTGASHEDNYLRIKILTEEGRKYANVEIPFIKSEGSDVVNIKARTIRPDGSVVNYEGKAFERSIVKARGLKYMAKTFTLPDVQVGGIIEYYYTIRFNRLYVFDSHWILSEELFTKSASFSLRPFPEMNYSMRWQLLPKGTEKPKEGRDHIIRLQAANIPGFQTEDYMPPANELKSRVDFTYRLGTVEEDLDRFWKNKGKQWNTALENFIGNRKAMEQAVGQIVLPNDTPDVKLQKIYARVQKIRNTSYEIRKTEQEQKRDKQKDINNVEEVWNSSYGRGVHLTWLFLALARAAGFEAYGVRASDRRNYFFSPNTMDANKLNANVVLVKVNGKDVYFDPGAAFAPYAMLPWAETGAPGLRLDKDGGSWVQTTLPESSESRIERKADLLLTDSGSLKGHLTITFAGVEAIRLRVEQRHADDAERKKFLEELARALIPATAELDLTNKPDWNSSAPTFVAEYNLNIPGWVSGAGRKVLFPVGIFSASEQHVFDHAERVHPIYFGYPFERKDDVTIALPLGWQVASLPAPHNRVSGPVVYTLKADNDHGTLHLSRNLAIDVLLLDTKYYAAMRSFFQEVRTGDDEQIVLQPIEANAGK